MNPLVKTEDGSDTIISPIFGEAYHSVHGAITESMHVFIQAGLHARLELNVEEGPIRILEMGLGTGLNAYLTALESFNSNLEIHYTGYEKFPPAAELIQQLNYPTLLNSSAELFNSIHDVSWNTIHEIHTYFKLIKIQHDIISLNVQEEYDIVYYDAFAPNAQSELWEIDIFEKIFQAMKKDACFVTYCAKGQVKRNLKSVGLRLESIPGPPGKREMTRAWKS